MQPDQPKMAMDVKVTPASAGRCLCHPKPRSCRTWGRDVHMVAFFSSSCVSITSFSCWLFYSSWNWEILPTTTGICSGLSNHGNLARKPGAWAVGCRASLYGPAARVVRSCEQFGAMSSPLRSAVRCHARPSTTCNTGHEGFASARKLRFDGGDLGLCAFDEGFASARKLRWHGRVSSTAPKPACPTYHVMTQTGASLGRHNGR